jgi:hypothetical protein
MATVSTGQEPDERVAQKRAVAQRSPYAAPNRGRQAIDRPRPAYCTFPVRGVWNRMHQFCSKFQPAGRIDSG